MTTTATNLVKSVMNATKSNTFRFYVANRLTWIFLALFLWMDFCSHFTAFKELWTLMFCGGCAPLVLYAVYVTDNPNAREYLMLRKWVNFFTSASDGEEE